MKRTKKKTSQKQNLASVSMYNVAEMRFCCQASKAGENDRVGPGGNASAGGKCKEECC